MSQHRRQSTRARHLGAAVLAGALTVAGVPAVAHAQPSGSDGSSLPTETGNASIDDVLGELPSEIVVGGGLGSENMQANGSGPVADAALSVGQTLGSMTLLEAVGVSGGSAAASLAASGSLPGSVYTNATGSIGSGVIGLGSIAVPEYIFPILSLQFATGFFTALGDRQEAGELHPHELDFWHGLVEGSAEGGTAVEDAADAADVPLPEGLAGSIDRVQVSAEEDPYEENERRRAEAEAAAEAESEGEDAGESEAEGANREFADTGAARADQSVGQIPAAVAGA